MDIPYVECKDGEATQKTMTLEVRVGSVSQSQKDALAASAQLALKGCMSGGAVIFPDWWQTRLNSDRPQLAILYREWDGRKFGTYYHTQHIPHYSKPKNYKPKFPDIKKGGIQATLTLNDNSKIIVNCATNTEAKRVINAYKTFVDGKFLKGVKNPKLAERPDELKKVTTRAVRAEFYSKGQLDLKPDWSIDLYE
ncbi:hypothetical protein [Pseudanabaena sp. 'Roaring Creek']|uniref:hypothetical protein n=1 Tax=Pseudanabaena sp. 'Roaring Creek' TaxID=1681830 RepID=UPI0006D76E99|nr:hypothetical protein [Pseudanabaena sp. 'Roaring Creek']